MNVKLLIKKGITVLTVMSILPNSFCGVNVFAGNSDMTVCASADFEDVTAVEGTHNGMELQHIPGSGGAKDGAPVFDENPIPYYGSMLKYAQTNQGKMQRMVFTLDTPITIGENAPENSYAEFAYDIKLEKGKTGILFDFGGSYSLNLNAAGQLISNNAITHTTITSGTNTVFNNIRVRVDLNAKTLVGIYVNDELVADLSEAPLSCAAATDESISKFRIYIGKGSVADTLYIDNVNVVTYTSEGGTSPVASKAVLKSVLAEIDVTSLTEVQKTVFDNAVLIAKNPIATQSEVDSVVEELKVFSDVTPDIPEPPSNEPFTMNENFESPILESEFDVTYGEGIITQEIFDDVPYGNNTLKIKNDETKKNVSQHVDFGLGKNKISFTDEKPDCYVEFGIDFSCYNMSKYGKNIFVYFRDSSDALMGHLYITGGSAIRVSGLVEGELILTSIEQQETRMNNVRIVMQMTDSEGNPSRKITAIYADDELLNASYPLHLKNGKDFDNIRVMISNVKDGDFGQGKEWSTNIDNMTVTKYYSANGETLLYTKGQLVSLMRGFDAEAEAKRKDKVYSNEQYNLAKAAINTAASIYMNNESDDEDIDSAYRELYFAKKRLEMPEGNAFDIVEVLTSSENVSGNSEIAVDMSVITAENNAGNINPVFVGILMKNEENADRLLDKKITTATIEPKSNASVNMTFDLSEYTEEEKTGMYIKLFAFDDISELKTANVKLPVLFGAESEVDNSLYRYADKVCAYQLVEDDVLSVFTKNGEYREENILLVFKNDFDFKDFSNESLTENLIYVNTSKYDKDGCSAFVIKGIPEGEYVYYIDKNKGKFISSDGNKIENALKEVQENPEKIEDLYGILGIDEEAYGEIKDKGVAPDKVLGEILKDKSYEVSEIQNFVEDFLDNLYMVCDFKSVKTADFVREAMDKYSGRIVNVSKYNSLDAKRKLIAEEHILDNKNDITSIGTLEELIDAAVEKARKHSGSGSSGSSGGGGGGGGNTRPSGTVIVSPNSANKEKEYGDIVEVHSGEFSDLENFEWAKPAIAFLAKKKSIEGKAEGIFAPKDMVTRAEFVKMLILTFGYELEDLKSTFSDVADESWYKPYVMTAAKSGIVTGYSDEVFGAEDKISRQDATVIIARVLENLDVGFSETGEYIPFIDEELIADYAKESVFNMAKSGVVNGVDGNYFAPEKNATRAEAAKLIYEAYIFMVTKEG